MKKLPVWLLCMAMAIAVQPAAVSASAGEGWDEQVLEPAEEDLFLLEEGDLWISQPEEPETAFLPEDLWDEDVTAEEILTEEYPEDLLFSDGTAAEDALVSASIEASGTCGDSLTWTLDSEGTLTISGMGAMWDFLSRDSNGMLLCTAPWGSVSSVVIDDRVTNIGSGAFYLCSGLTAIHLPSAMTSIGEYAFNGCSALTDITLPSGLKSIGANAFFDCRNLTLTDIHLPKGLKSIGAHAFCHCKSLTAITLPKGLTFGESAFFGCSSLTDVTLPSDLTSIPEQVFTDCSALKRITLPDGVASIGRNVFSSCTSLAEITMPSGLKTIDIGAFRGCTSLTALTLPAGLTDIGFAALGGCTSLASIAVQEGNQVYFSQDGVLYKDEGATLFSCPAGKQGEFRVPAGVTRLHSNAFDGCGGLRSIILPEGLLYIENDAFSLCTGLSDITIPSSVWTSIGAFAFRGCTGLRSITLPPSVRNIGSEAFHECKNVTIYGHAGSYAQTYAKKNQIPFKDISSGTCGRNLSWKLSSEGTLTISGTGEMDDYDFAPPWGHDVSTVVMEKGVTSIGKGAFSACSGLKRVTLPDGLQSIGERAFSECSSLEKITIPSSVTSFGFYAFSGCSLLTIYGCTGSFGEIYAKDSEIPFVSTGTDSPAAGTRLEALSVRDTLFLTPPADGSVYYRSSDEKVARVDNEGQVWAVGAGTAVITAFQREERAVRLAGTWTVTVEETSLRLPETSAILYAGAAGFNKLSLAPQGGVGTVRFRSSNPKAAKVSAKGVVTAVKAGKAVITAYLSERSDVTASCTVTVKNPTLSVSKSSLSVKKGKTASIKVTAVPAVKVTFNSSAKSIAKVSAKGKVTGVKKGTCKITVKAGSLTKTVKVTVK